MAASIVHEINQPLAAIAMNAQAGLRWLTRATPDIDEARAALARVVADGRRATEVVAGIRMMFKSEGRPTTTHDVNELVREVLTLVRGDVENQRVTVSAELAEELPQVPANPVQLRQVPGQPGDERGRCHEQHCRPPTRSQAENGAASARLPDQRRGSPAAASIRRTYNASSIRSSPRNRTAWEWGSRSAAPWWKIMAADFESRATCLTERFSRCSCRSGSPRACTRMHR